jgi:hypothetical protein
MEKQWVTVASPRCRNFVTFVHVSTHGRDDHFNIVSSYLGGGGFLVAEKMDFYMKHDLGNVEAKGHENKDRSGYQKACRGKIAPI